jgi:hypothetical protein
MPYEDWTLRKKAEVRLAEHSELRSALGLLLHKAPDHTTL